MCSMQPRVTLLMICSICGDAMHQSCGNTSGDSSFICFSCLGIDCAQSPEEVAYLKIANDLAEEFCIEALFPSNDDVQLKSLSVAGIPGDLEADFCLEESSDVVNFQLASFPFNHDPSCAMQHPDQVVHSTDEAPPTLNSSNFGGTEVLCLANLVLALYLMLLFMVDREVVFEVVRVLVEGDLIACPGVLQMKAKVEGDEVLQLVGQLVGQRVGQLVDQAGVEVEAIKWAQKSPNCFW
jgi:hypothetical protein